MPKKAIRAKKQKLSPIEEKEDADDSKSSDTEYKENFRCKKCGVQFTLASNYRRHVLHNKICGIKKQGFKCSNCHKAFSLNATLKDHYERCTAEDPYRFNCPNCPKLFTFKSSLNKHLRGRCRFAKKTENKKMYKCNYCDAEFFSYIAWRKHLSEGVCTSENNSQKHVCPHCANRFTLKSSLNKHIKGRCKAMKQDDEEEEEEGLPKFEIVVDISQENEDDDNDNVTPYEIITNDVIEECPEWETFETEDVESYIEIANENENEDYEFMKVNS